MVVEFVRCCHQVGLLVLDDRQHAVGNALDRLLGVLSCPVGKFLFRDQIPRIRKGGYPATVLQAGIPADMIRVQMGA
jgi:hypothetical protein